jgi:hypothetical protein
MFDEDLNAELERLRNEKRMLRSAEGFVDPLQERLKLYTATGSNWGQ